MINIQPIALKQTLQDSKCWKYGFATNSDSTITDGNANMTLYKNLSSGTRVKMCNISDKNGMYNDKYLTFCLEIDFETLEI